MHRAYQLAIARHEHGDLLGCVGNGLGLKKVPTSAAGCEQDVSKVYAG